MMLRDVSCGSGRADGEGTVEYFVDDTSIDGRDGVTGCTFRPRAWYQAKTAHVYCDQPRPFGVFAKGGRPLYPNFFWSWLAPATAKRGDEKKSLIAVSMSSFCLEPLGMGL